jgi:hypothetical protein
MSDGIRFNEAAFKHKVSRFDIEWAVYHPIRDGLMENEENKYLLVGFDTKGNPLEVMYNRIDDETINVFHAMKCRKDYLLSDLRGAD